MIRPVYGVLPSPVVSPAILAHVKTGRIYDLSFPISARTPHAATTSPFSMTPLQRHDQRPHGEAFGEATEILTMSSHTATHIEALCHVAEKVNDQMLLFGDVPVNRAATPEGFAELGIEQCPPIFVRGILLDVPRAMDLDVLPDSYGITRSDIERCFAVQGVTLQKGDAVLIRTGFSRYRNEPGSRFTTVGAGPTPQVCRWLADQGITLTGSDTMSFEQVPSPHEGHIELIRKRGISIIKQANLEDIARDAIYSFLLIVLPLPIVGATASPVRPIAVC
jgi:kynurenine formamidase